MLKTNSKKAIENLKAYIMESWNIEQGEDQRTWPETKKAIQESFIVEAYNSKYQRQQNRQEAFIEWLQGLPRGLGDHVLCRGQETLGQILEETEKEQQKYEEMESQKRLSYLIYREVFK